MPKNRIRFFRDDSLYIGQNVSLEWMGPLSGRYYLLRINYSGVEFSMGRQIAFTRVGKHRDSYQFIEDSEVVSWVTLEDYRMKCTLFHFDFTVGDSLGDPNYIQIQDRGEVFRSISEFYKQNHKNPG